MGGRHVVLCPLAVGNQSTDPHDGDRGGGQRVRIVPREGAAGAGPAPSELRLRPVAGGRPVPLAGQEEGHRRRVRRCRRGRAYGHDRQRRADHPRDRRGIPDRRLRHRPGAPALRGLQEPPRAMDPRRLRHAGPRKTGGEDQGPGQAGLRRHRGYRSAVHADHEPRRSARVYLRGRRPLFRNRLLPEDPYRETRTVLPGRCRLP